MNNNKSKFLVSVILSSIIMFSLFFVGAAPLQANQKIAGEVNVETELPVRTEGNTMFVNQSNGVRSEIRIMPDTASEIALNRLRLRVCSEENNCTIELKEVGEGEQTRIAYEFRIQKESKVLGLFRKQMKVSAQVNAENGEIIRTEKPWWAFLASEKDEREESN